MDLGITIWHTFRWWRNSEAKETWFTATIEFIEINFATITLQIKFKSYLYSFTDTFVFCHTVTKDTAIDDTNLSWLWSVISRVKSLCCDLVMGGWLGSRSQRSFVSLCSDFKCSYTKSQIIAAKKRKMLRNVEKY